MARLCPIAFGLFVIASVHLADAEPQSQSEEVQLKDGDAWLNKNLYFGFYQASGEQTQGFTNLHLAKDMPDAVDAHARGQQSLLSVLWIFFNWIDGVLQLRPEHNDLWHQMLPGAQQLIANNTIIGFDMGDELVWNCLEPSSLEYAVGVVREAFPRGEAIIWYNEASIPITGQADSCGKLHPDYKIPEGLDWYSVDIYHVNGLVENWVENNVKSFYNKWIFPNITEEQRVGLVPGSFGSDVNHYPNGTYVCDRTCYDRMCTADAHDFIQWAQEDDRVALILPWNWDGCPTCDGSPWTPPHTCCMDEIGTKDQPILSSFWKRFGTSLTRQFQQVESDIS